MKRKAYSIWVTDMELIPGTRIVYYGTFAEAARRAKRLVRECNKGCIYKVWFAGEIKLDALLTLQIHQLGRVSAGDIWVKKVGE